MVNTNIAPLTNPKESRTITLEQNKRLSDSLLWRVEKEYFERKGIEAWLYEVPYYITSNPFIAKSYARVVINYIHDWALKHPETRHQPFYIMELGTGPGRFSYYMVKVLDELRLEMGMHDIKIMYVMSDFAKANIDYYQSHHALLPYVEKGLLDFATHDMDKKQTVKLINSKIELNQQTLVNPLVLFANYVFDTIPNDAFAVNNGKLYELLTDLSTVESNLENNKPVNLEYVNIDYRPKEVHGSYYNDPEIDGVLELYKNELKDTSFLFPIGSIRALDHLRKLANGNMLLISSDKAYSELQSLENLSTPSITAHGGCFSMMVNCHAIGQYFKNGGGDFYAQSTRRGLKTCVYTTGATFNDLPGTRAAIKECIEKFSITDFFNVYRHMNESAQTAELDMLASYLQLTEWDPHAYMKISGRIMSILTESDAETVQFLANNMHRLAENYYYMPKVDSVLFEVGTFFHALQNYSEALKYYRQASQFIQGQFGLYYNIGLCLHQLNQNQEALSFFKKALENNPDSKEANDWVVFLQNSGSEKEM